MKQPAMVWEGDSLKVSYEDEGVTLLFSRLREERDGLSAEVEIKHLDRYVHPPSNLNLSSSQTRDRLASSLAKKSKAIDWEIAIPQTCHKVIVEWRKPAPIVNLAEVEPEMAPSYLVRPILPKGETTLLFADGAAGKSMLALWLAVGVSWQLELPSNLRVTEKGKVLYLDWETHSEAIARRLKRISEGFKVATPQILYREMLAPLTAGVSHIKADCQEHDISLIVIDSLGAACSGDINESAVAIPTMNALRALPGTKLVVHHVTHEGARSNGRTHAFGCHSDDTEYLSRSGWKRHQQWTEGEEILCFDMATSEYRWEVPTKRWRYDYEGEMVRLKGGNRPSFDLLVTPNHNLVLKRWYQYKPKGAGRFPFVSRDWLFMPAENLKPGGWLAPLAAGVAEERHEPDSITIPGCPPYEMRDFLRLVGWWVSEGSIENTRFNRTGARVDEKGKKHPCALTLAQASGPLAEEMKLTLKRLGVDFGITEGHWTYPGREHELPMCYIRTRKSQPLARWMAANCGAEGAPSKSLPEFVFKLIPELQELLLSALVDGDGSRHTNGRCEYHTSSTRLADDVQRLALMAGRSAAVRHRPPGPRDRHPRYTVNIRRPGWRTIEICRRHYSVEPYNGPVWCFTTPTGSYMVRRNGMPIVTGNSRYFQNLARSGWELRRGEEDSEDDDTISLALFHTKVNEGKQWRWPIGLSMSFEGEQGPITVTRSDPESDPTLAKRLGLRQRITIALKSGKRDAKSLADELDVKEDTIKRTLNRMKNVVRLEEGGGRGVKTVWGLQEEML